MVSQKLILESQIIDCITKKRRQRRRICLNSGLFKWLGLFGMRPRAPARAELCNANQGFNCELPKDQYELFSSKNEKQEIVFKSEWKNKGNPLFFRHLKLLFWQFFSVKIIFIFFAITKKRGGSKQFSTEEFAQKINVFARFSRISSVSI